MCGRYRLNRADRLAAAFATPNFEEFSETRIIHSFDFRPSNRVPIVRLEDRARVIDFASWGFVPSWASRGETKTARPINARSETVAMSGMFKAAFRSSRCLLPADGFFEPKGPKTGKKREQFYFHRADEAIFAFAGLESGGTCLLLTTTPNGVVGPIHDRMPVILRLDDYGRWLDPATSVDDLQGMLRPAANDLLLVQGPPEQPAEKTLFG